MFYQHISEKNYEIEFERLGIRTAIMPLSDDELEECRRMKGADGARYALYLACPALHEEGEKLYKEGKLFSPLDIVSAVDMRDVKGAYQLIQEISGVGEARVRLYKNNQAGIIPRSKNFPISSATDFPIVSAKILTVRFSVVITAWSITFA